MKLLFGGSSINFLRGPAHFRKVVTEQTSKGKYDPTDADCNFAIPSNRTLGKIATGYPKEVPPGFIQHSIDVAKQQTAIGKQFVVCFDGKNLVEGSKGENTGDIDMWGVDKQNKTSQEALKERDCTLSFVRNAMSPVTSENILQKQIHLQKLVKTMSHNTCSHSRAEFFLNKRFTKMQATNPGSPIHYQCVLGAIHVKTADCKNVIHCTLELNLDVCRLISQLKSLPDAIPLECKIQLGSHWNSFVLHPPTDLHPDIDLD